MHTILCQMCEKLDKVTHKWLSGGSEYCCSLEKFLRCCHPCKLWDHVRPSASPSPRLKKMVARHFLLPSGFRHHTGFLKQIQKAYFQKVAWPNTVLVLYFQETIHRVQYLWDPSGYSCLGGWCALPQTLWWSPWVGWFWRSTPGRSTGRVGRIYRINQDTLQVFLHSLYIKRYSVNWKEQECSRLLEAITDQKVSC